MTSLARQLTKITPVKSDPYARRNVVAKGGTPYRGARELSSRPNPSFLVDRAELRSFPSRRSSPSLNRLTVSASTGEDDGEDSESSFKKKRLKLPPSTRELRLSPDKFTDPTGRVSEKKTPDIWKYLVKFFKSSKETFVLVALLGCWYAANIYFNIYNKQVLSVFPLATTCTSIHLATASILMLSLWLLRIKKAPQFDAKTVKEVAPLSSLHLMGFLLTNMSLGAVNVSLTHTIKSLEPFFTVFLSYIFLGSVPSIPVMLTLFPIVAGVVVASATDISFNWYGFLTAMGSNLMFQSRNVISKKYMVESSRDSLEGGDDLEPLDEVNLFACITLSATILMLPVVLALDGSALYARWQAAGAGISGMFGIMKMEVFTKTVLAGVCRTADVLASYALLSRLNPVSHSVSNCIKRVVVIAVSIVFFKTPASFLNVVGTALALFGVFAYSMAKRMSNKSRPDLSKALEAPDPSKLEKFLSLFYPNFLRRLFSGKGSKDGGRKGVAGEDVEYNL
ncbi:hypothetical protein CYMTET_41177 [Cymbomonas tetramitiformis]|uniref:Sugar phosphate transporter domain-containing protein n=1 Tax=Cymbomonas tetramitiformis TaxID=36881 RepID=A0AAE0C8M6_9CHLO|nr:hypothetical protein CYMTET_41177 [Cymbomonas tetramitiformis]